MCDEASIVNAFVIHVFRWRFDGTAASDMISSENDGHDDRRPDVQWADISRHQGRFSMQDWQSDGFQMTLAITLPQPIE